MKVDNRCIKLQCDSLVDSKSKVIDDVLHRYFEEYELRYPNPFYYVKNSVIVSFTSAREAERAVIEKNFSPINGRMSTLYWFNI